MGGSILALDLATRTGFAVGPVGEIPRSGCVVLKEKGQEPDFAYSNLIWFLNDLLMKERPAVIVKEAPLALHALRAGVGSQASVELTYGLHAITRGMGKRFGIEVRDAHDASVRKHFIGRGKMDSREETKRAVVQRCHLLGYMPKDCNDDNRGDALATWDWAAATIPNKLYLFGERAA